MTRAKQFDPEAAVGQAMKLFWRKGYASTTPQALADELGIGKGSLYHAFENKRQLFALSFAQYAEMRLAGMAKLLQAPGPTKERLRQTLLKLLADREDPSLRGCLAVNTAIELGADDEAAAGAVQALFDGMEALLLAAVERGQQQGEIEAGRDPRQIASLLLSTMLSLQLLARAGDPPARRRRMVDAALAGF